MQSDFRKSQRIQKFGILQYTHRHLRKIHLDQNNQKHLNDPL
jgi:hypothetical protein